MTTQQTEWKAGSSAAVFPVAARFVAEDAVPAVTETTWEDVREACQVARRNARTADVDRALALADDYLTARPEDGRALTYRGSLAALRARLSWLPWKKLSLLNKGIGQMEEGVARVRHAAGGTPLEMEVRLVRATTSASIPAAFGRAGVALSDFKAVVGHPQFSFLPPEHRATALAWLAALCRRRGEASEAEGLQRDAEAIDLAIADRVRVQAG